MEPTTFMDDDDETVELYKKAIDLLDNGDHIKALEIIEDMISVNTEEKNLLLLDMTEGHMLTKQSVRTENPDVIFTYVLGSVGCYSEHVELSRTCADAFNFLAQHIGSVMYYKECVQKAKQALSVSNPNEDPDSSATQMSMSFPRKTIENIVNEDVERMIKDAEFKINISKIGGLKSLLEEEECEQARLRGEGHQGNRPGSGPKCESEDLESNNSPLQNKYNGLKSFWLGLDVKVKRDFMKVSIAKLLSFVREVHGRKGRDALKQVLDSARKDRKWTFWMCRTICLKEFSSAEECKNHLEQVHALDFKPSKEMVMVERIGKEWAHKIKAGGWKPVNTTAAVEMIKNQLSDVKAFAYKSGWSKEWPIAVDEVRSKLLKEIKDLLERFCELKILPCSVRDYVMGYPFRHLDKLKVPEKSLVDSHLMGTPQSICFLEHHELSEILTFLKRIKCERGDGIDLVCRAVDSILGSTFHIDFDHDFSYLLLDRRLLKSNIAPFDDEGTINFFNPNVHCAKAHAQGDDIISWLTDYCSVDNTFPRPIREHNLCIWVAVLRAFQFTCRTLGKKYAKKMQVSYYEAALTVIEVFCMSEYERRRNLQKEQWDSYASLLCDICEERFPENSLTAKLYLCAVRDVLEGASDLTFDFPDFEECLNLIRKRKNLSDDTVLKSIDFLKSVAHNKVLLLDSKILLIDNSRISLLNNLTRLSVFDNRTYILPLLKPFLLNEILKMESKAKIDAAAEADLLRKEEKKPQSKKKNNKIKKQRTSTSMPSPLHKTGEHKPSVNLEPECTSPSLKTVEENSTEPDDIFASESGRLEISSNTVKKEYVMQNIPGEDLQLEHLESALGEAATRHNLTLDMTLKALLNIKILKVDLMQNMQPFQDHLEEQVPPALQNFFTAFVSEVINNEGVYSCLLGDLLASLQEVIYMSSDAAEVLVAILEFWHCWKNAERESLVTRLFTLEEYERMSCRKCKKKPNYPEQSSYGIVMAADSIRDLKYALGNIEFEDIFKVIRMEYKMLCNIKTGGCGITNFVHQSISKCPPIFTIVLEWKKSETEKEISETTKALDWEIDISRMYEGLEPNTNYQLVSMVGFGEEGHICLTYENNRWVNLRHGALTGEDVGNWKNVVKFCEERKVRLEILFYEASCRRSMA